MFFHFTAVKLKKQKQELISEMMALVDTFKESALRKLWKISEKHKRQRLQILRKQKEESPPHETRKSLTLSSLNEKYTSPDYIEIEIGSPHGIKLTGARPLTSSTGPQLNKLLSPPSRPCVFVVSPQSEQNT